MAGRRTKGEGSIYQRESDGRWVGVVDLGFVGGKRLRPQVTAKTLRELRPKFKALKEQIEKGILTDEMTVADWMEQRVRGTGDAAVAGIVHSRTAVNPFFVWEVVVGNGHA